MSMGNIVNRFGGLRGQNGQGPRPRTQGRSSLARDRPGGGGTCSLPPSDPSLLSRGEVERGRRRAISSRNLEPHWLSIQGSICVEHTLPMVMVSPQVYTRHTSSRGHPLEGSNAQAPQTEHGQGHDAMTTAVLPWPAMAKDEGPTK